MQILTANEAKTHFGDLLLQAQSTPVQITKNGKPAAVVVSFDNYNSIEQLKMELLKAKAKQSFEDIKTENLVDGDEFFNELLDKK